MLLDVALTELMLAKDYTSQSRQRREYALGEFVSWAKSNGITNVEDITTGTVRRYVADLRERPNKRWGEHLAGETQHSQASIVRMFLRFAVREGWLNERVVAYFDMPKRPQKVVQILTRQHYMRLVHATDERYISWVRLRDKAMLALLFDTGLRASELCSLKSDAVFISPKEAYIRVDGKGRKQRELPLGKQTTLAMYRYIHRARPDSDHENVFLGRDKVPMTPSGIDKVLYILRDLAGAEPFEGIRVSAHTMRHSFAVHFMQQGGDIYKLSRLMGHDDIRTTQRYLRAFQARDARRSSRSVLDSLED